MTPEEFAKRMAEIAANGDTEYAHADADNLMANLLDVLGYSEGVRIFTAMVKWYA